MGGQTGGLVGAHQVSAPQKAGMDHQVACTVMLLRTATWACPVPPAGLDRTDPVCPLACVSGHLVLSSKSPCVTVTSEHTERRYS